MATFVRTLTDVEIRNLLRVSFDHKAGLRDHVIFVLALKTGLREHEILGLNVGDVSNPDGTIKRWVQLTVYKRSNSDKAAQVVALNDLCRDRLARLLKSKKAAGHAMDPTAPLFLSRERHRLSTRQLRHLFGVWQERAHFDRKLNFHMLRHTACTKVYKAEKDAKLVQKFARHKSLVSTGIYTHVTDSDLERVVEKI